MKQTLAAALAPAVFVAAFAQASNNPAQPVIDACIERLIETGDASRPGGQVISSEFSEAATQVILQDGDGEFWTCFGYSDGTLEYLRPATEDEIAAGQARAAALAAIQPERIAFAAGTSGAELQRQMEAGGAQQFVLGAREGQVLTVQLTPQGGEMYYFIRNPDGSILLEGTDAAAPFRGQLGQSGDHIVEVVSKENASIDYRLSVTIE